MAQNVLRSFRLSQEHCKVLEEDAKRKGISVNSLVSSLVTKYVEWDRLSEKFGRISITPEGYRDLMEFLTDEDIIEHGKKAGSRSAKEVTVFWYKTLNVDNFFRFLSIDSKYSGVYQYELERDGGYCTLTLHHELGPKVTLFLRNYMDNAIRSIVGAVPTIETHENAIVFNFKEPLGNSNSRRSA